MPAQPLTPVRGGPRRPRTGQSEGAENPAAGTGLGDPHTLSGPAAFVSPALLMGALGWGLLTRRFTVPSAPNTRHGIRPLADARQHHYNPPGSIPGPGGLYLIVPLAPKSVGPAAHPTPPVTLASAAKRHHLKPWASRMPPTSGRGRRIPVQ
jgi:hypothetical protein